MKHIKRISVAKASSDPFGMIFLQLWATVFFTILTGAFGGKR